MSIKSASCLLYVVQLEVNKQLRLVGNSVCRRQDLWPLIIPGCLNAYHTLELVLINPALAAIDMWASPLDRLSLCPAERCPELYFRTRRHTLELYPHYTRNTGPVYAFTVLLFLRRQNGACSWQVVGV